MKKGCKCNTIFYFSTSYKRNRGKEKCKPQYISLVWKEMGNGEREKWRENIPETLYQPLNLGEEVRGKTYEIIFSFLKK